MLDAFRAGKISIDPCNRELVQELMNYHYDEDLRLVKVRNDLISAMRYAWMMRRKGKPSEVLGGIGYGSLPYARKLPDDRFHGRGPEPKIARGTHFDVFNPSRDFDPFTGR